MYKNLRSRQEYEECEPVCRAVLASCAYPPYRGDERYLFLGFNPLDAPIAVCVVEFLVEQGYKVCYDDKVFDAAPWTSELQHDLDGCHAYLSLAHAYPNFDGGNDEMNERCTFARRYADLTGKAFFVAQPLTSEVKHETWPFGLEHICEDSRVIDVGEGVHFTIPEPFFRRPEREVLFESFGFVPHAKVSNGEDWPREQHDLAIEYVVQPDSDDAGHKEVRTCNLRTYEEWALGSYDEVERRRRYDEREDEGRYVGMLDARGVDAAWGTQHLASCRLLPRSAKPDYELSARELAFWRETRLDCLDREIAWKKDRDLKEERQRRADEEWRRAHPRTDPYMDEFEYVDSLFD